jgi:hypothetical protein
MRVALVGVHSLLYSELAELTWDQNKKLYCERYGFFGEDRLIDLDKRSPNIAFDKIRLCLEYFNRGAEWIWATGTDSLITDFTNDLSLILDTKASFIVASDRNGINADSFFVKNDNQGKLILDFILSKEELGAEQQAIIDAFGITVPGVMSLVPQRVMNSYNYELYPNSEDRQDKLGTDGHWQYGDLLIHWPGFSSRPDLRCEWAKQYMHKIKR